MNTMIGQRIKERRKSLNITGKQIKEATGISTGNLSEIENGKILPSATALMGLSQVLNCSTDYILFGNSQISEFSENSHIRETEQTLLYQFSNLPDTDQEEILMMVELKYNRTKKPSEPIPTLSLSKTEKEINEIA